MLFDIGIGIIIGVLFHSTSDVFTLSTFVSVGILFSLLPDIDFPIHFLRGGTFENEYKHRNLLHVPLLLWPIGSAVVYLINPILVPMFLVGTLIHFMHDSVGIGWGVRWFYPFSKTHYAFLYRVRTGTFTEIPKQLVYAWTPEQVDEYAEVYHDEDWIRNIYFKWHPYAIAEAAVFVVAILYLINYTTSG